MPIDLLKAGLTQTFNLQKCSICKAHKVKSKARHACTEDRESSIQEHRVLQGKGSEVRLMEGIFQMRAIIELKSEQRESMCSFPERLRDERWSDRRDESSVLPMGEEPWRNSSWALPIFAVVLPLV